MDYSKKSLVELRAIAKEKGIKKITTLKKGELIEELLKTEAKSGEKEKEAKAEKKVSETAKEAVKKADTAETKADKKADTAEAKTDRKPDVTEAKADKKADTAEAKADRKPDAAEAKADRKPHVPSERKGANTAAAKNAGNNTAHQANKYQQNNATELEQLDSGEVKSGILEVMSDGYGFIRCDNFLPGEQDVYVSPAIIRRFGLRTGDIIVGNTRIKSQNEKFSALLYLKSVNGYNISAIANRPKFEDLTPIFPNSRIHLETAGACTAMRMVDLISPIGKGQRGMIVSQPKAGKTTLLKQVAKAVNVNHPEMHVIILLIDERPEEVTDIKEYIEGDNVEVIYSTFDELPENHKRVSEMVIERAKRLVEHGRDVMILLDSITRLARAYNLTIQPSGRTLSGGLDPAALYMPKRFFGAARNMREGGSLTILATALVDTGSRMDDVVFEEFKGTGNMELVLDRSLSEKRIFPAIDLPKSSTRRDDLLLTQPEMEASFLMRRAMNGMKSEEAVERIIKFFVRTKNNREFIETIKKVKIV